jgi:hypothetical protein
MAYKRHDVQDSLQSAAPLRSASFQHRFTVPIRMMVNPYQTAEGKRAIYEGNNVGGIIGKILAKKKERNYLTHAHDWAKLRYNSTATSSSLHPERLEFKGFVVLVRFLTITQLKTLSQYDFPEQILTQALACELSKAEKQGLGEAGFYFECSECSRKFQDGMVLPLNFLRTANIDGRSSFIRIS